MPLAVTVRHGRGQGIGVAVTVGESARRGRSPRSGAAARRQPSSRFPRPLGRGLDATNGRGVCRRRHKLDAPARCWGLHLGHGRLAPARRRSFAFAAWTRAFCLFAFLFAFLAFLVFFLSSLYW